MPCSRLAEVLVPWRPEVVRRDVEALGVEVLDVLGVLLLGLGVGVADGDELEESGAVRVRSSPLASTNSQKPSMTRLPILFPK